MVEAEAVEVEPVVFSPLTLFISLESLYVEQSDQKRRINFNTREVLVVEVNTYCVKQQNKKNTG